MSAPWTFDPQVDAHAFRLLGFAETSAGISRTQRENREGWYAHVGKIPMANEARWTTCWNGLESKLQQDHIDALCEDAELAVLSSDVVHHSSGESWSVISAVRLEQRLPQTLEVLSQSEWRWERVRGQLRTDVHALLLRRRPA